MNMYKGHWKPANASFFEPIHGHLSSYFLFIFCKIWPWTAQEWKRLAGQFLLHFLLIYRDPVYTQPYFMVNNCWDPGVIKEKVISGTVCSILTGNRPNNGASLTTSWSFLGPILLKDLNTAAGLLDRLLNLF